MPRRCRPRKARSRSTAFFRRSRAAQGGAPARLLVGLGNPGADAARHRHNVGFLALDALATARGVGPAMPFHRVEPTAVIVLHDEVDLAAGKVRAKCGGGVAGHNGLRSIRAHIGADFWRVRIGIGHPGDRDRMTGHVLSSFGASDRTWLDPTLDAIVEAFPLLMAGDASAFMSRVAILAPPPGSGPARASGETTPGAMGGV